MGPVHGHRNSAVTAGFGGEIGNFPSLTPKRRVDSRLRRSSTGPLNLPTPYSLHSQGGINFAELCLCILLSVIVIIWYWCGKVEKLCVQRGKLKVFTSFSLSSSSLQPGESVRVEKFWLCMYEVSLSLILSHTHTHFSLIFWGFCRGSVSFGTDHK